MHHPPFGHINIISLPPPAVATNLTHAVPASVLWRLLTVWLDFTTDANVANRGVKIKIISGVFDIAMFPHYIAQTASLIEFYTASASPTSDLNRMDGYNSIGLPPDLWLLPGFTIETDISNIQAGDQLGITHLLVEEWIQP